MTTDRNSEFPVAYVHQALNGNFWMEWFDGKSMPDFRERYLYTTPPASIPAAEVQALVERIESVLAFVPDRGLPGIAKDELRRELAKLIPRGK